MPIISIDNYQVNVRKPIDTRMVASSSIDREAIGGPSGYIYEGLTCFQIDTKQLWTYTGGTWSLNSSGSLAGSGSVFQVTRYNPTATLLQNSAIYSTNSNVGIYTTSPKEILQINALDGNNDNPLTIRKDVITSISDNLWFDSSFGGIDNFFTNTKGSGSIKFNNGNSSFELRTPNSSATPVTYSTINPLGFIQNEKQVRSNYGIISEPSYSWSIDSDTGFYLNQYQSLQSIIISNDGAISSVFSSDKIVMVGDVIISANTLSPISFYKSSTQVILTPTQSISSNIRGYISGRSGVMSIYQDLLNSSNENWITYSKSGGTWSGLSVNENVYANNIKINNVTISNGSFIKFRVLGGILFFNQSLLLSSTANRNIDKVEIDFATPLIGASCDGFSSIITPETLSTAPSSITITKVSDSQWNTGGALVFGPGYNLDGTGGGSQPNGADFWLTTPHFWLNGTAPWNGNNDRNSTDSRINASGIWFNPPPADEVYIGFRRIFNVPSTRTYYVAMSADNYFRISFNGTLVVDCTDLYSFNWLRIYPVTLNAGVNIIEMSAANAGSVAAMVAEIYDNTISELQAATSASMLNILFTTGNLVGQAPDLVPIAFGPLQSVRTIVKANSTNIINGSVGSYNANTFTLTNLIGNQNDGFTVSNNSTYRVNGYGVIAATAVTVSNLPSGAPVITPSSLTLNLVIGQFFSTSFTATNNPTSWAIGTIPSWMNFSYSGSNATLSGTPTSTATSTSVNITATNIFGTGTSVITYSSATPPSVTLISDDTSAAPITYNTGYNTFQITLGTYNAASEYSLPNGTIYNISFNFLYNNSIFYTINGYQYLVNNKTNYQAAADIANQLSSIYGIQASPSLGNIHVLLAPYPNPGTPPTNINIYSTSAYRTQVFRIGNSITAGNLFAFGVYGGHISVVAINGDTPTSIASQVASLINQGRSSNQVYNETTLTYGRWRDMPAAPTSGLPGGVNTYYASYPLASSSGSDVTIAIDISFSFSANAYSS